MKPAEVLLPYQQRWVGDRSRVRVWEKSRRIGASYCEALQSAMEAAKSREAGGQDTFYLSYNKEMTQTFIRDCAFWAKVFNMVADDAEEVVLRDEDRDITVYRIRFASGFNVWGLPSEPRSLRSKQGRVILDEAAFVDDLPELMKAAFALLMWGGSVSILSTHNGEDNAFNELIKDIRAGNKTYSLHRTTLDDAIADGLFKTICKNGRPPKPWSAEAEAAWRAGIIADYGDGADEELFCIPNRSSGAYLTAGMIEACMDDAPVITWAEPAADFVDWPLPIAETWTRGWIEENLAPLLADLPREQSHFCGVDFGRSGDLSVFWPATEQRDLRLTPPFVLELRNCPHRTQQQILFAILDKLPRFSGVSLDARGNGSALAEACRQQYGPGLVREVMISEAWYRETMPLLKAGIEDRTLMLPKDSGILSDFRSLRVVKGVARVPEQRTRDKTGGRHGDSAIACAMMLDARKELGSVEPWEYVGIPMEGMDFSGW
ncbi:hypothetical protein [Desulfovibrio sp. ZJ200]|uniref:hypothetical protein n=1 Tax=Desulfovibrio sp. ZJ200 TaxID=2709792 RepID=UPI0013EE1104|nr:hypothetical protein [Desulfovibrio sp. ZJ200]